MGETLGDLAHMLPKAGVSAAVLTAFGNPVMRRAKDRNEAVVQLDRRAELSADLVQPNLGHVGPDAQDVGHIGDTNRHSNTTYAIPATKRSAKTNSHCRQMSL